MGVGVRIFSNSVGLGELPSKSSSSKSMSSSSSSSDSSLTGTAPFCGRETASQIKICSKAYLSGKGWVGEGMGRFHVPKEGKKKKKKLLSKIIHEKWICISIPWT